jgi:hypothetical protein
MENEDDLIVVDNGDLFWGTREQFRDAFFSNATDDQIIGWCKNQGLSLIINGETIFDK